MVVVAAEPDTLLTVAVEAAAAVLEGTLIQGSTFLLPDPDLN